MLGFHQLLNLSQWPLLSQEQILQDVPVGIPEREVLGLVCVDDGRHCGCAAVAMVLVVVDGR